MDCDSPDFVPSIFDHNVQKTARGTARKGKPGTGQKRKCSAATVPPEANQTTLSELSTGFEGECDLVPRKHMDALILQYNQLLDQYKALKHELEATQEENKQLKEQLGRSNFRFDSIKNEGYKGEGELLDDFVTACSGLTNMKTCIPVIVKEEMEDMKY
ncbi:uncharacterized protein AKAME5_000032700 [Lates japonicus]|uniref:Uncharacterized protein n=1 Tax=Lates japonicus TaxID=270547 RepID=A0AAD3QWD0_LATJO|nr:uncharacterized protein AKAME5_000032700 [Lates japonicus]